jgi:hypothetical protein
MSDCCAIARARRLNWFGYVSLNIFFFGGLLLLGSPIRVSLALDFRGSGAAFVVLLLASCACFVWASASDPGFARCAVAGAASLPTEMESIGGTVPGDTSPDDANAIPRKRNTTGTPTTAATSNANSSVSIDMSSLAPVLVDSASPPSGLDSTGSPLALPDESPAHSRRTSEEERVSLIPPISIVVPASAVPPAYCAVCRIVKPPRSKHCYECNRCVLRFDHVRRRALHARILPLPFLEFKTTHPIRHIDFICLVFMQHCPFLGQCVGGRNHYKFWWFLFTQTATLFWALSDVRRARNFLNSI